MKKTKYASTVGASFLTAGALALLLAAQAQAQQLSGDALVEALQSGGYVIVMRHASASIPAARGGRGGFGGPGGEAPTEPVLNDDGIGMVTGMRFAFRELKIPVGDLLTSPTQRTRQHASHFGFGEVHVMDELGTDAMRADSARSEWLAAKAAETPRAGTNTVIVTHAPNIQGAFNVSNIAEGESLVVRPGGGIVARVPYTEWVTLALD